MFPLYISVYCVNFYTSYTTPHLVTTMSRVRAWVFRISFANRWPTGEDLPEHWEEDNIRYISYQFEQAAHSHIQGFVYLKEGRTKTQMKAYDSTMWLGQMAEKATFEESIAYTVKPCKTDCSHPGCIEERVKDTKIPDTEFQRGRPPERGDGMRDNKISDTCADYVVAGRMDLVRKEHHGYYMMNKRKLHEYASDVRNENAIKRRKARIVARNIVLKPWQQQALEELEKQDDRQILWIWDEGETGKSNYLGGVLELTKDVCSLSLTAGKSDSLALAYDKGDCQPYVHIDIPFALDLKDGPYTFLEDLKNGKMFCPKYDSKQLIFDPPKVIVTANHPPCPEFVGKNRYTVRNGEQGYALLNMPTTSSSSYTGPLIASLGIHTPHGYTKPLPEVMEE